MTKRINKRHSPEYKEKAITMAKESGNAAQTARNLGISYGVLNSWIIKSRKQLDPSVGFAEHLSLESHNKNLEKENQLLRDELEFLKKAAA